MNIDHMLNDLVAREGGYVDHPADRGGPTNWGITQGVARAAGYMGDMRALPRETALTIYRDRYWAAPGFDRVARTAPDIAAELFDTGVNMGPGVAAAFLQRALNVLNPSDGDSGVLAQDGVIGPITLRALAQLAEARGAEGLRVLLTAINGLQASRYIELAEQRPANRAFIFGWLSRRVTL